MKKVSKIKMEEKSTSSYNPWSELTTITTFDRGNNIISPQQVNTTTKLEKNRQIVITSYSQSLLIQALVNKLCEKVEPHRERRYNLYFAICEKLHRLNLIDSSYNMEEFNFAQRVMQDAVDKFLSAMYTIQLGCTLSPIARSLALQSIYNSRYEKDFKEISYIAGGGFGKVYKVFNRIDRTEYAIKKVYLDSAAIQTIEVDLKEVEALARLNHPNIVPYKSAWVESNIHLKSTARLTETSSFDINALSCARSDSGHYHDHNDAQSSSAYTENSANEEIEEINSEDEGKYNVSHSVVFRDSSKCSEDQRSYSDVNSNYSDNSDSSVDAQNENRICTYAPIDIRAILYIQMGLCEQTLENWLRQRTSRTPQPVVIEILTQIFKGLNYIHSQNIVHHDIKPSNIFINLSGQLTIQVGDFGLACHLSRTRHTDMGGTTLYAAPEQLEGKCLIQNDTYSAGIVLFELLVPTSTRMEHVKLIKDLRKGQLPTTLAVDYPILAQLVSQLVQDDPKMRPTTDQVLKTITTDKEAVIAQLQNEVQEIREIVQEKDTIIQEKEITIKKLRERILFLEAQYRNGTISNST